MTVPHDLDAEQAVLGSALLSGVVAPTLLVDDGLRAEHFYREQHRSIWAAMTALVDRDIGVDRLTLVDELRRNGALDKAGGEVEVQNLAGPVPDAGNVRGYARIVIDLARWRTRQAALHGMATAVEARDEDAFTAAEGFLGGDVPDGSYWSPDRLADELVQALGSPGDVFPFPYPRLNRYVAGGMRRGEMTVVAGRTRIGKSAVIAETLLHLAAEGAKTLLLTNETMPKEMGWRWVANRGRIPLNHLLEAEVGGRELTADEARRMMAALPIPVPTVLVAGWPAVDIARQIRLRRPDVAAVDLFNRIPMPDREAKDEAVRLLDEASKLADCHILLAAHLNRERIGQPPALGDLRDTAMLENSPANVLFVHRDEDKDTRDPMDTGMLRFAKVRHGREGGMDVLFNGRFQTFEPAENIGAARAAA